MTTTQTILSDQRLWFLSQGCTVFHAYPMPGYRVSLQMRKEKSCSQLKVGVIFPVFALIPNSNLGLRSTFGLAMK